MGGPALGEFQLVQVREVQAGQGKSRRWVDAADSQGSMSAVKLKARYEQPGVTSASTHESAIARVRRRWVGRGGERRKRDESERFTRAAELIRGIQEPDGAVGSRTQVHLS